MTAGGASLRPWWAGLGVKLFGSYLIVVAIGIGTLVVAAGLATPSIFDLHMAQMMGNTGPGRGPGMGMGMGQVIAGAGNSQVASQLDAALADAFRAFLGQGLLVAGAAAVVTAIGASLLVSHRIASPVITLARASHRIAEGHYAERVGVGGSDELGDLCTSFNSMAAALEATERRRIELIGDVAHELRTPLTTLRGYLEGLIDGVVKPSDQTWAAAPCRDRAPTCSAGRCRAARSGLRRKGHSPGDRAGDQAADCAGRRRSDSPGPHQPARQCPALHVGARPGGREGRAQGSREVAISVADTGVGISPEHLPRIFDRFYRVDKSRSRALGGSGVGLTIARALVEAMGGQLWAESPGAGRGTTFTFTLPATA